MTIRVFLLDSHESVRKGLRAVLDREDDMEIAGEADTVTAGLARIEATRPDVVLADLMLSDGGGLGVCRLIKARRPGVACLVLGAHGSDGAPSVADRADAPGFAHPHHQPGLVAVDSVCRHRRLIGRSGLFWWTR